MEDNHSESYMKPVIDFMKTISSGFNATLIYTFLVLLNFTGAGPSPGSYPPAMEEPQLITTPVGRPLGTEVNIELADDISVPPSVLPLPEQSATEPAINDQSLRQLQNGGLSPPYETHLFMGPHGSASPSLRSVLPYSHTGDNNMVQHLNPIVSLFQQQELAKAILGFVVPITIGLLTIYHMRPSSLFLKLIVIALSFGVSAIWNGLLLHQKFPRIANALEQLGVVSILLAFFGVLGSLLPAELIWVPWLCFGFSLVPFAIVLIRGN